MSHFEIRCVMKRFPFVAGIALVASGFVAGMLGAPRIQSLPSFPSAVTLFAVESGHVLPIVRTPLMASTITKPYVVAEVTDCAGGGSSCATPIGAIDGTNATFTLSAVPLGAASVHVYLNGIHLRNGGAYTLSGAALTLLRAPDATATLDVDYTAEFVAH